MGSRLGKRSAPASDKGGGALFHPDDLFLGAYALMKGGELQDVEVRGTNGRRTAVFRIGMEQRPTCHARLPEGHSTSKQDTSLHVARPRLDGPRSGSIWRY